MLINKVNQLKNHSVQAKARCIARFPCDSTAFLLNTLGGYAIFGNAPLTADEGLRASYQLHNDRSTGVDIVVLGSCIKNVLGSVKIGKNRGKYGRTLSDFDPQRTRSYFSGCKRPLQSFFKFDSKLRSASRQENGTLSVTVHRQFSPGTLMVRGRQSSRS